MALLRSHYQEASAKGITFQNRSAATGGNGTGRLSPIRVGVIGRGFGARVHAPAFRSLADVEVVGLAGSENWRDFINDPQIDIISIATPPASHCALVCHALEAGKHVLCEKPFGVSAAEARIMRDTAQARRLVTGICFQFRMEDGIAALMENLSIGRIGRLRRIDVKWLFDSPSDTSTPRSWKNDVQAGGGVINAFASHVIDYVEWISGRSIISVTARSQDVYEINGEMTGGILVTLKTSNAFSPAVGHRIEIHGDRGRAVYFHAAPFEGIEPQVCLEIENGSPQMTTFPASAGQDSRIAAFRKLASSFIQKVSGNAAPNVPDFTAGLRVRTVLDAVQESIRTGGSVRVSAI